ncbi:hypothetical protein [Absidia glauca]|uniref:BHLH domain-containing protein n=1 Tax=Absidia glauca TaxID=4829 RepID=A0A163K5K1_ABSGL|nr:hypothetical protein [Absidia glauca]
MDYTLEQSRSSGWMFSQQDTTSLTSNSHEPLQEPVPFEDFQVSFGLDPRFAVPVPLDDMPLGPTASTLDDSIDRLFHMDYQQSSTDHIDNNSSDTYLDYPAASQHSNDKNNNPLLDENDQKAFSQFLDAFFVDNDGQMSNAEQMASQFSTMYDIPPPPPPMDTSETIPYHVATSMFLPKSTRPVPSSQQPVPMATRDNDDDDEYRRNSILQSLDQQKQERHQRLSRPTSNQQDSYPSNAIFLQRSNQVSAPFITKQPTSISQRYHLPHHAPYRLSHPSLQHHSRTPPPPPHHHSDRPISSSHSSSTSTRRNKSNKELLTEEEKRSNHIASEQKRRSTIRTGFKDLTDIVPTLKNLNNSKSTVLFKAVDYIKYLEKRNKSLREKMESLEVRIKVEGQVSGMGIHSASLQQPMEHSNRPPSVNKDDDDDGVTAAIRAHRSQQNQLLAIQEQLQYQQRMLAQDDDHAHHSLPSSSSSNSSSPSDLYPPRWNYDVNDKSVKMEVDHEDRLKLAA